MAFQLGEPYTLFFGRQAAAPTSPADPENMASLHEIGEIDGDIVMELSRAMAQRRDRNSPGQVFIHPATRGPQGISFPMNFNPSINEAWTDLIGCMESNTDGVGAAGNLGYFAISNGSSGAWIAHGQASPENLPVTLPVDQVCRVDVTLRCNGDPTLTTHD